VPREALLAKPFLYASRTSDRHVDALMFRRRVVLKNSKAKIEIPSLRSRIRSRPSTRGARGSSAQTACGGRSAACLRRNSMCRSGEYDNRRPGTAIGARISMHSKERPNLREPLPHPPAASLSPRNRQCRSYAALAFHERSESLERVVPLARDEVEAEARFGEASGLEGPDVFAAGACTLD